MILFSIIPFKNIVIFNICFSKEPTVFIFFFAFWNILMVSSCSQLNYTLCS